MIDEFDRCNPKDAIEFLEITNQMFSKNKKVIVIYSYVKSKIENMITSYMGIDDDKYINKFIDIVFTIHNESQKYWKIKLENHPKFKHLVNIF